MLGPLAAISLRLCSPCAAQIYDTNGDYVQTFAGSGEIGFVNGQGQLTKFSGPSQIVADTWSNLYVWDSGNAVIRKITPSGSVSTFAGGGTAFQGVGSNVSFSLYDIGAMAMDRSNTIWVVATYGSYPYLLNINSNAYVSIQYSGSSLSNLNYACSICFDSSNNLYYSSLANIIYRYNPTTCVSMPFAGNGSFGYVDGNGTIFPEFSYPAALASDEANNIYVWDSGNYRIRRIDQSQNVTTIAGNGSYYPIADGQGTNATFGSISQMFSDNMGNVYLVVSDALDDGGIYIDGGLCIRKLDAQTNVVTMAGSFSASGYMNGPGSQALFSSPRGACLSQGMIFVADYFNERIRNITFSPQPQVVSGANLAIATFPGLTITGAVGRTYQVQTSPDMNSWSTVATFLLTSSPYLWIDQNPLAGTKFYRALLLP
jgi:hypothetical protein